MAGGGDARSDFSEITPKDSLLSRRSVLKRMLAISLGAPTVLGLVAACSDDDGGGEEEDAAAEPDDAEEEDAEEPTPEEEATDEPEEEATEESEPEDEGGSDDAESLTPTENTVVIVDGVDPGTLTPMTSTTAQHSITAMYESLVEFDENIEIQPLLSTSWEASEDGLEWSFQLREGVMFHNGVEFTSEDVKATIDYILDENVPASRRGNYTFIQEVDTSDPYVARFVCESVNPDFVFLMGDGSAMIMNADHLSEVGYEYDHDPIGTGPYEFVEYVPNHYLRLTRFEDYWGEPPEIQHHVFRPVVEFSTRVIVMDTGEADAAFNMPPAEVEKVEGIEGVTVYSEPGITVHMIEMKVATGPLSDPRVRRALNMAVDKQGIIDEIMLGYADPLLTPGIPGLWGTAEFDPIPFDPEQARALLAEAGYPDGFQLRDLVYFSGQWPGDDQTVEAVQGFWANIGVQMGIERRDFAGFVDALRDDPEEFEGLPIMPIRSSMWNDYHLYRMYHSDATHGDTAQRSGYRNEEVDRLLEAQREELDEGRREELLRQAQELIWEDQPFIYLFHRHNIIALRDNLDGYWIHPANHMVPKQLRRV